MNNITIQEEYILPSKGLLYNTKFDPCVKLRSMTVAEEMKRLSRSDNPYKVMSEIIDECLITKLPFSVYDLCLGDYSYLLHRLRTVTYGPEYRLQFTCPKCKTIQKIVLNLDELNVREYDKSIDEDMTIILPVSNKTVRLRFQTPRDLDEIEQKKRDMKKKSPEMGDPSILLTVASFIDTIDGNQLNPILGLETLKRFPLKDMNYLVQKATKLNEKVGIDSIIDVHCNECGNDVKTPFRYTSEFFGPAVD